MFRLFSSINKLNSFNSFNKFNKFKHFSLILNSKKEFSTNNKEEKFEPTFLHFSLVAISSYTTVFLTSLGGCFLGLELNIIDCNMFHVNPEYCVDEVNSPFFLSFFLSFLFSSLSFSSSLSISIF